MDVAPRFPAREAATASRTRRALIGAALVGAAGTAIVGADLAAAAFYGPE